MARVYVAKGYTSTAQNTGYYWDDGASSYTATSTANSANYQSFGGTIDDGYVQSAAPSLNFESFSRSGDAWTTESNPSVSNGYGGAVVGTATSLYHQGGGAGGNGTVHNQFTAAGGSWSSNTALTYSTGNAPGGWLWTSDSDKISTCCGFYPGGSTTHAQYSIAGDNYASKTVASSAVTACSSGWATEGNAVVMGGWAGNPTMLYAEAGDSWSSGATLPSPVSNNPAATAGTTSYDVSYIFAGSNRCSHKYTASLDSFTTETIFPDARSSGAAIFSEPVVIPMVLSGVEQMQHLDYDSDDNLHWPGTVKISYTLA